MSTKACNLRRCTYSCPCKVPGPPSWLLDAIGQRGLSLFMAGALSMELLGPRGQCGGMHSGKIGYVCLLACTLSLVHGLRKRFFFINKNMYLANKHVFWLACLLALLAFSASTCPPACWLAGSIACLLACVLACFERVP